MAERAQNLSIALNGLLSLFLVRLETGKRCVGNFSIQVIVLFRCF